MPRRSRRHQKVGDRSRGRVSGKSACSPVSSFFPQIRVLYLAIRLSPESASFPIMGSTLEVIEHLAVSSDMALPARTTDFTGDSGVTGGGRGSTSCTPTLPREPSHRPVPRRSDACDGGLRAFPENRRHRQCCPTGLVGLPTPPALNTETLLNLLQFRSRPQGHQGEPPKHPLKGGQEIDNAGFSPNS